MKIIMTLLILVLSSPGVFSVHANEAQQRQQQYLNTLDGWVALGVPSTSEEEVRPALDACVQLVFLEVSAFDLTKKKQEFINELVGFCMKLTVHRVWPQKEFQNTDYVRIVCGIEMSMFPILCRRAQLL